MTDDHVFEKWLSYNRAHLERCAGRRCAMTLSGGKDSSVTLHFLCKVRSEYDLTINPYVYAYPLHRYDSETKDKIVRYWGERGVEVVVAETDQDDTILEQADNPCRPCQNLRKQALPEMFRLLGCEVAEIVLVSGHSLWDLAGYALDRFTALHLAESTTYLESYSQERFLEISQRFYPFLTMPEGYSVYRPMLYLNAEEIQLSCAENSLPVLGTPCKYALLRPKKNLGQYFKQFGYQFTYEKVLSFAKTHLGIADVEEAQNVSQQEYLTKRF